MTTDDAHHVFLSYSEDNQDFLAGCHPDPCGEIYCTSVHKFKGLESPVVILAEIDGERAWNLGSILYVGCSRACNHLVLLVAEDVPEKIGAKLL